MPKKNVSLTIDIGLVDTANRPNFKANPTLAAGDFKVSLDGGNYANLGTLPTVVNSGKVVRVVFSQAEMNHDTISLVCSDASGAEWDDQIITFNTTTNSIDDVAVPGSAMTLANNAITSTKIQDGAITSAKFTVGTITGVATGILEQLRQLWLYFFGKADITPDEIITYDPLDDATPITTQPITQTSTLQRHDAAETVV